MFKVLVVDDEYHMRNIIKEYFELKNITVIEACNGYEALSFIDDSIDPVLLDIIMSGIDGYEICKQLRTRISKPIIFMSALSEEENQIMAYELGADDYITKPFNLSILYAKVLAMIKRDQKIDNQILNYGHIRLDCMNHILIVDQQVLTLAHKEYEFIYYLCKHHNQLLTREQILDTVWGYDYYGDGRAEDTYIKKLRKKLGKYSSYI